MKTIFTKTVFGKLQMALLGGLYMQAALIPAYASDTEVYARKISLATEFTPTLMFLLDTSGSMNDCVYDEGRTDDGYCANSSQSRYEVLKRAMAAVLKGGGGVAPIPGFIKVGISEYKVDGGQRSGRIVRPARRLDAVLGSEGGLTSPVRAGRDDVEQPLAGGAIIPAATDLELGYRGSERRRVGFRFDQLALPKNAVIQSAHLEFVASASDDSELSLKVRAEDANNSAPYTAASTPYDRQYYGDTITLAMPAWFTGSSYQLDVTSLVQKVVNRSGWCGGNALALAVEPSQPYPDDTNRVAKSYEAGASPKLVVDYIVDANLPTCIKVESTASTAIAKSSHDINWKNGQASARYSDRTLYPYTVDSAVNWNSGLRFALAVPKSSTINRAVLRLKGFDSGSSLPNLSVGVFDTDNVSDFCTYRAGGGVSSCSAPTYATTPKSEAISSISSGQSIEVDVTSLVQGIVNRGGWNSGQYVGFRLVSSSSANKSATFYAFDGSSASAASLEVNYLKVSNDYSLITTVRDDLVSQINSMVIDGNTPLGAAYIETASYMMGHTAWNPSSDPSAVSGGKYISPIDAGSQCSSNFIFVLSDGLPTSQSLVSTRASELMQNDCDNKVKTYSTANQQTWWCFASLGQYLNNNLKNRRKAIVRTSTALFGPAANVDFSTCQKGATPGNEACDFKASAVEYGNGAFYTPGSEAALVASINDTVSKLLEQSGTVTAPGVAVNQFSQISHLDQLYYAVFDPEVNKARWEGNVKRYRLDVSGSKAVIRDQDGKDAIDPASGFFAKKTRSYWLKTGEENNDDSEAVRGGVAKRLPSPNDRKLYSFIGAYPSLGSGGGVAMERVDLTSSAFNTKAVAKVNPTMATGKNASNEDPNTQAVLYKNLMRWFLGYELTRDDVYYGGEFVPSGSTPVRNRLAAVLHSRPTMVNYGYSGSLADATKNASLQDNTLYFSTTEGVLHAVNANTGVEQFAYIPQEMLGKIQPQYDNPEQAVPEFGMDSSWTVWREDSNHDFRIASGGSDKVYLFGGVRMGGRNYYALDVTNRDAPRIAWVISPNSATAFQNMGQTWSQPTLATIKLNGQVKAVLVFGGGYDEKHESAGYSSGSSDSDSKGNQVYIVDASTGELYWWASATGAPTTSVSEMKFAIPSRIRAIDIDSDGLTDTLYVGDLGGQVFRIDLNMKNTGAATLASAATLLAKLGQTVTANTESQRRFYEPPAVTILRNDAGQRYVAVALGSGYRSHPLDKQTQDHFYVLNDSTVLEGRVPSAPITLSDLSQLDLGRAAGVSLIDKKGWYVDFIRDGEKMINAAAITDYEVIFSSYVPDEAGSDPCKPVIGVSYAWIMSIKDGSVRSDANGDGSKSLLDRNPGTVQGLGGDTLVLVVQDPTADGELKKVIGIGTGFPPPPKEVGEGRSRRMRWYEKTQ